MKPSTSRLTRRICVGVIAVVVPALLAAHPAAAADRTMPHLKFACPAAIGDHKFAGILPDGPAQEQCFFDDGDGSRDGSSFTVGASWATTPTTPGDIYAVCAEPAKTSWHEDSTGARFIRVSATRRANVYVSLNLYWPTKEKLARQKALLPQAEALADKMLAAAEKLAQPCLPATPTTGSSPSTPDVSPSASAESSATPSPTNQEPLCTAIEGRLTDNDGHPVEGLLIRLSLKGKGKDGWDVRETATDAQGRYRFGDIPDTEQTRAPDAARLGVVVQDGNGTWRVHAGASKAALVTKRFALTEADGCRHDFATTSLGEYELANPTTTDDWADLWTVVTQTRRALAYATSELGIRLRDVPIVVYAWCPPSLHAGTCTPNGDGAFAYDRAPTRADRSDGLGGTGRVPYLALAPGLTKTLAEAPQDDTVYHEIGHILQSGLAGGFARLVVENRTVHGGYANASSNDSWIEGFASWFAVSVRSADGRRRPYYEWNNGARQHLEPDIKAWDGNGKHEEWAVAGLLTDLTDSDGTTPGKQGRLVPFTVTGSGMARLVKGTADGAEPDKDVVVVDFFDSTGKLLASDEAYLFKDGRFLDVPSINEYASALVSVHPIGETAGRDDDPLTMSPRKVIELITDPPNIGTRGGRQNAASTVFDMSELHSVLRSTLDRAKDVDALFVAHGFHENDDPDHKNTYVDGATIGLTTHPPFHRLVNPRYDARVLPTQYVEVDTGGVQATVVVFPQHGVPYTATPDAARRVPVTIPGSLDSRAAVVTLADSREPAVTVIEGKTFWPEEAKHDAPFLTIQPDLQPVAATTPATPAKSGSRSGALAAGAAATLLGLGIAAATLIGLARRRRRRAGTGQ